MEYTDHLMVSIFSHCLPHSMGHSMIIFACCLLKLEKGHSLTHGLCVFLVPPQVFDLSQKPPHPGCSLYVKAAVISRFNTHVCVCVCRRVIVRRLSTLLVVYKGNVGG